MPLTSLHTRIRQDLLARYQAFARRLDVAKELSAKNTSAALLSQTVRHARAELEQCQRSYAHAIMAVGMPGGPAADYARRKMNPFLLAFADELASANAELVRVQDCETPRSVAACAAIL